MIGYLLQQFFGDSVVFRAYYEGWSLMTPESKSTIWYCLFADFNCNQLPSPPTDQMEEFDCCGARLTWHVTPTGEVFVEYCFVGRADRSVYQYDLCLLSLG